MKQKIYLLAPDKMKKLAHSKSFCTASDQITVEGRKVGYMTRVSRDNSMDSGWRFHAGDESGNYVDDHSNYGTFSLNDIANYDPDVVPLLSSPTGSVFRRVDGKGDLVPVDE